MKKLRILLVDDHTMLREGLHSLLDGEPGMHVVGEAANGKEVLQKVNDLKPDVVVMDLSMPEMNGLQATELLKDKHPEIKVIALTAHEDESYLMQLCKAGAVGFVLKRSAGEALIHAIRMAERGEVYFEPSIANKALARQASSLSARKYPSHAELSEREKEVLRLVAWGFSNKEVADDLNISVKTVETYKIRIAEKLNLHSRAQLVQYALRQGWLSDDQAPRRLAR